MKDAVGYERKLFAEEALYANERNGNC